MKPELNVSPEVGLTLEEHILLRQHLSEMKKELEKQLEAENDIIKGEMEEKGLTEVEAGDYAAVLSVRERSTLDKTELISMGVTTEQIKRATKVAMYLQLDVKARNLDKKKRK